MTFDERPLIITDLETTGLDGREHEVIELAALSVNQQTLTIENILNIKMRPTHIENADPMSLELNGYSEFEWDVDAKTQNEGWDDYFAFARNGIFCSYSVSFDWDFVKQGIRDHWSGSDRRYGPFERHLIDIPSIAWGILGPQRSISKNPVAQTLGFLPEGKPHTALAGARHAWQILRVLRERAKGVDHGR